MLTVCRAAYAPLWTVLKSGHMDSNQVCWSAGDTEQKFLSHKGLVPKDFGHFLHACWDSKDVWDSENRAD